jgi:hypothetical protein
MKLPGVISLRKLLPTWAMPNALRGLGAQVVQAGLVLDDAQVGLEHHVELARLGPRALGAAVGAVDLAQRDVVGVDHRAVTALARLLLGDVLLQVVGPEALVTGLALGQRVGELTDVPGGDPGLPGQDHRGVQADDVVPQLDHRPPPLALDVLLEGDPQGPVVPRRPGASVDLATGEDEAAALAEGDDRVDGG